MLGNGGATPTINVAAAVIASPPTSPTVVSKASQRATVSWTGATGAISYTVTATDTTNAGRGGQTCTTGSTSCTLTGLTNGDNYTFAVTAYNGFLTSAASASTSSTAITGTPLAPTALVATVRSATSVSISFTAGSNGGSMITKYQYSTNAGSTWADVSSGGTSSTVSITGLTAMTKYSVTLRAVNATGNGESSAAVSVTPMEQMVRSFSVPGLTSSTWKFVNSVSCVSDGNCSVGGYHTASGIETAFVVSQVSGVWQTATSVADIPLTATDSQVTSVSCASAGNCSAGGYFTLYDAGTDRWTRQAFVLTQVGGVWGNAIDVPGLADIDLGNWSGVNAVSCASAGNCAAGGFYSYDADNGGGVTHPFVVSQVAGVWQTAIEVPGGDWVEWASGAITSVSCPGVGNCVAGGWSSGESAFVVSLVDGVWQDREAIPGLSGIDSLEDSRVSSVSCSSVGNCAAVGNYSSGTYVDSDFNYWARPQSFVASQVNGVWQSAFHPTEDLALLDFPMSSLRSVSCPSDGNCTAIGWIVNSRISTFDDSYQDNYDQLNTQGMALSQIDGVWQSAEAIDDGSMYLPWDSASELSISCWSSGNCRAVGEISTVTQNSGTWGSPTNLTTKALSVSCPTERCTMGGEGTDSYIKQNGNKFPSAPVGLVATALNASVSIAFVPGDLGILGTVTKYQYSKDNGSWTDVSAGVPASPSTITGLTNGTAVSIRLRAFNATGAGAPSDAVSVTSATTPSAPTGLSATATAGGASISFTAGATGGSAITKYQYTIDNGSTWVDAVAGTISPVSIRGLTDGTTYSVKLRAVNAMGNGAAAASAASVTPCSTAWMPTSLVATPGDGSASIAFTDPGSNGGSSITNYKYQLDGGSWVALSPTDATSPVTIPGLTNGTTYSVKLLAVNAAGDGYGSDSVSVTPVSSATAPDAPTTLAATPGDGSASIAFTPGADGGASITNYKYQLDGGSWVALSPTDTTSPVTIPGLTNGTSYSVKLQAVNSVGDGTASSAVLVTPRAVPAAPTSLVATPGNNSVSVEFTAGASNGSTISNYEYELNGSGNWFALSPLDGTSPVSIAVSNGVAYTVKLRAVNEAGSGAASDASDSFTPRTTPSAPTSLVATPGNGSAQIAFTPGQNGGATISKYQYKIGAGAWTDAVGTSSPITVSGLTNFTVSSIRLRAVNEAGNGAVSVAVAVTARLAGPSVFAAKASGTTGIVVSFTLTPLPGTTVSYQSVTAYARDTNTVAGSCRTFAKQTTCFIGGLTRATDYDLRTTAYLPVIGKSWHNATLEGTIRQVRTNR
jgi:titin